MAIAIQDLKVGQIAYVKVSTPPYLVLEQKPSATIFLNEKLEIEAFASGYAERVKNPLIQIALNTDSGVSHLLSNGRSICGARWNRGSTVIGNADLTCGRCKKLANLMGVGQ